MGKKRVLSGMRATGRLHLGNLGLLELWADLQTEDCFYMVADWHVLTTDYEDTSELKANVRDVALDFLSAGLDPERSTLFVQSHVLEHAELHLLLSMITPIPWLERNPTYKEMREEIKGKDLNVYGLLGYPVLQAADILIYKADVVPVGEDQAPHVEMTREIARRFNNIYGTVLTEPQVELAHVPRLPGIDGRKMSKSYGNAIYIADDEERTRQKVMKMLTDPARKRRGDKGHPEVCTVFFYHKVYHEAQADEIAEMCREAQIGCVECKEELAERLNESLRDIRARRREFEADPDGVQRVLAEGRDRAREIAAATMKEVRQAVRI